MSAKDMGRFTYFNRCVETIAAIDPDELSQRKLGDLIGSNTSTINPTHTFTLGEVILKDRDPLSLAVKQTWNSLRLTYVIRDLCILADRVPEIIPVLPYFTGAIAIKGALDPMALLTEDASRNKTLRIKEAQTRDKTLRLLAHGFADFGGIHAFDQATLEDNTAFEVGGNERLLDFFPSVFSRQFRTGQANKERYSDILHQIRDQEDDLTIEIDKESPLAQSLM